MFTFERIGMLIVECCNPRTRIRQQIIVLFFWKDYPAIL